MGILRKRDLFMVAWLAAMAVGWGGADSAKTPATLQPRGGEREIVDLVGTPWGAWSLQGDHLFAVRSEGSAWKSDVQSRLLAAKDSMGVGRPLRLAEYTADEVVVLGTRGAFIANRSGEGSQIGYPPSLGRPLEVLAVGPEHWLLFEGGGLWTLECGDAGAVTECAAGEPRGGGGGFWTASRVVGAEVLLFGRDRAGDGIWAAFPLVPRAPITAFDDGSLWRSRGPLISGAWTWGPGGRLQALATTAAPSPGCTGCAPEGLPLGWLQEGVTGPELPYHLAEAAREVTRGQGASAPRAVRDVTVGDAGAWVLTQSGAVLAARGNGLLPYLNLRELFPGLSAPTAIAQSPLGLWVAWSTGEIRLLPNPLDADVS